MEIIERKETKQKKAKPVDGVPGGEIRKQSRFKRGFKSMFTTNRKYLILGVMFVLLCVTGYLNFALNTSSKAPQASATVTTDLFTTFRNTRADERTRDIMVYENLIATSSNSDTVASAEAALLELRSNVAFETSAEGLILAENYDNVLVNKSNGFVNVLLKRDTNIDSTQAVKIMSILQSIQPDLDIDNVYISIME